MTALVSHAVTGGTIYTAISPSGVGDSAPAMVFVPTGAASPQRRLRLTDAYSDVGVGLTATATGGAMGVSRTAGTSLALVGEATSSSAKTDKAMWEFDLPDSYVAGANIPVSVNVQITGSGTLTAASCTLTVAVYTESDVGVEAAIAGITAATQIVAAGSTLVFTVPGTGLASAQRCVLELTMLITSSSGANTGQINSVAYQA